MIRTKWKKIEFGVGDVVKIGYLIKEKGKERTQPFQGRVIKIRGRGESKTFTVRKLAVNQIGVERVFPLNSPWIKNLKVLSKPKKRPRRSKLYYLRDKKGKKARI
ncbi:50S ribosomal protein L19 [Candidatus Shapirobacteria bacterium]|nr:50S ribosomal protein L19 [Candidatus Shapirobacteria bacterium]